MFFFLYRRINVSDKSIAVKMRDVSKSFGPVMANDKVWLDIYRGEILALLGENGSGKTTLMNILSGIYTPDEGHIYINDEEVTIRSPREAFEYGIGMIHQHYKLVEVLTAAENIILGVKQSGRLDISSVCEKTRQLCEEYGLPILMHTGDKRYDYSNTNRLIPILETYTNLTIIGAHMGGWSLWDEASLELKGIPNLYVDCSSTMYWVPLDKTAEIIRRYGADRVLFGTDYPMWHPKDEVEMFFDLGLSDDEMKLILSENVKKIYGLSI